MASVGYTLAPPCSPALNWNRLLATAFLALSVLDLVLTWRLLGTPGTCFYEANPVAGYILNVAGWWGLALYKLICAGTVVGVSALLVSRRPWLARGVLAVACPVLCLVVGYSLCLASSPERQRLMAIHEQAGTLSLQKCEQAAYRQTLTRVARAVLRRQRTLVDAAGALKAHLASLRYSPLQALEAYYPTLSDEARLAVAVVREATYLLREHLERTTVTAADLRAEFASAYACPFPVAYGDPYVNLPADSDSLTPG